MTYDGCCPICSAVLDVEGPALQCPSGEYVIERSVFESLWDAFEKDHAEGKEPDYKDLLLKLLKENRIKVEPPAV